MNKKLYRDEYHKVLGGVCSGLADYFDMDVTVVRLLFAFTFFVMGVGLGTYIILWIVLPKRGFPYNAFNNPTVDYTMPQQPADQFNQPQNPFNNPFGGGTYGNSAYTNRPYGNNPYNNPLSSEPVDFSKPKQKSNAGIIVGVVLIVVGAAILVDEYDLIPDFDFDRLWPAVLVIVGGALMLTGRKQQQPWDAQAATATETKEEETTTGNTTAADEPAANV
jgi:phage shock protein C